VGARVWRLRAAAISTAGRCRWLPSGLKADTHVHPAFGPRLSTARMYSPFANRGPGNLL